MTDGLLDLSDRDLQELSAAIRSGRVSAPYTQVAVRRVLAHSAAGQTALALEELRQNGLGPEALSVALDLLRADRARRPGLEQLVELVTTGPDTDGTPTRDTSVVVRELFANAQHSVLVAGYAVYRGDRVFRSLAQRMQEVPHLRVRLVLDIQRGAGETMEPETLERRFMRRFQTAQWPEGCPLPEVFFDRRSVELGSAQRTCMHAKVVVVDDERLFVSSANFTEAAQLRNIEVGVKLYSKPVAQDLTNFFEGLIRAGVLISATLPGDGT